MNCSECIKNNKCQKPYESKPMYQKMYLGRTFTEEEWKRDGICSYFEPNCGLTMPDGRIVFINELEKEKE